MNKFVVGKVNTYMRERPPGIKKNQVAFLQLPVFHTPANLKLFPYGPGNRNRVHTADQSTGESRAVDARFGVAAVAVPGAPPLVDIDQQLNIAECFHHYIQLKSVFELQGAAVFYVVVDQQAGCSGWWVMGHFINPVTAGAAVGIHTAVGMYGSGTGTRIDRSYRLEDPA